MGKPVKKPKKYADMNYLACRSKRDELVRELLTFKLSLDASAVKSEGGIPAVSRDLKALSRKMKLAKLSEKTSGGL